MGINMKCVPMIFNGEMIKALLEGRKTVTRRIMKPQPTDSGNGYMWWPSNVCQTMVNIDQIMRGGFWDGAASDICPLASVGDLIWVRETFTPDPNADDDSWDDNCVSYVEWSGCGESLSDIPDALKNKDNVIYSASESDSSGWLWKPSIHMPRWASRLTLKVTDVRIEQVQSITEEQSIKEGMLPAFPSSLVMPYRTTFMDVWDDIYGNWTDNPYAWVIEFEVIHQNIDEHIKLLNQEINIFVYTGVKEVDADHYRFMSDKFAVEPTKITRQKIRGRAGEYTYTVHFIGREPMIGVDKKSLAGRESKEPIPEGCNPDWVPPKDGWIDDVWVPVK